MALRAIQSRSGEPGVFRHDWSIRRTGFRDDTRLILRSPKMVERLRRAIEDVEAGRRLIELSDAALEELAACIRDSPETASRLLKGMAHVFDSGPPHPTFNSLDEMWAAARLNDEIGR
jgi:hypothetical protein